MSRLTTTQIIDRGDYLKPDFDASSLTVSQLLGVLGYHNIPYPTPFSKPKLVQVFNQRVKTNAQQYSESRDVHYEPSDDGITDGLTGDPVGSKSQARRTSRKSSRASSLDQDEAASRPEPAKRRRSSAQPTLGGTSSRKSTAIAQPVVIEESEPEDEPPRKVGRKKEGSRKSRSSINDDSGWDDNNVFQSGPDTPSPVRQSRPRPSSKPRKSRKSSSAPPQMADASPPNRLVYESGKSPRQSKFEPELPAEVVRETRMVAPRFSNDAGVFDYEENLNDVADFNANHETDPGDIWEDDLPVNDLEELDVDDEQTTAVSKRLAGELPVVRGARKYPSTSSIFSRTIFLGLIISLFHGFVKYKAQYASIGYCDTGKSTSIGLETYLTRLSEAEACRNNNDTLAAGESRICPGPDLFPIPRECVPCPEHSTCSQYSMVCDNGFIVNRSPLPVSGKTNSFSYDGSRVADDNLYPYKALASIQGAWPYFAPVCVPDEERKKKIGALGKHIQSHLAKLRGERLCSGNFSKGGEGKKWGMSLSDLRETCLNRTSTKMMDTFDETFQEAIQQVLEFGEVFVEDNASGERFIANKKADMTWPCEVTVKVRGIWERWRPAVYSTFFGFVVIAYMRYQRGQRQIENKRVGELVQVALDMLRNQEMAYHTNPVSAPQPYLSSLQLRDLVLQDMHSVSARKKMWKKVEGVVEGNTNIQSSQEEVEGGDEMRVWRWIGSAGRGRKSLQMHDSDSQ